MNEKFSDKSAATIIVDPSGSVRTLIGDVLKSAGFKKVQGVGSLADAMAQLETEEVDWLILPLAADQEINGLQVMQLCLEVPHLQHVRVSLLLEENETWCLSKAFELGLLSWHAKPFTKVTLGSEIDKLMKRLESSSWNMTHASAEFVREYLASKKDVKTHLAFEKSMLDVFPGNGDLLIHLAEAQLNSGKKDLAKAALSQAKLLQPDREESIKTIAQKMFGDEGLNIPAGESAPINAMGIKSCVIVDSDETIRQSVKESLASLGVPEIQEFNDGITAWEWLEKNSQPDLLVMEWRLPKLTGPLLMQRVRHHGFHELPIIVLSSLIKPEDMPLIREIGIANVVSKPIEKSALVTAVVWTVQQERLPTEQLTLERKIRSLLTAKKVTDAQEHIGRYLQMPNIPEGKRKLVEAELAFATGNATLARDTAVLSIKSTGENINVLNILAKSFMQLGDFTNALKCFERAQKLSPLNIERLCMIAEAQVEVGEGEKAKESMEKASQLDPDATQVKEAEVKMAVFSGDTEVARALMSELESLSNVLSYMNNKAVASARCGKYEEGIVLYEKTLASIPADRKDLTAIVRYNMGLAKVRGGDLEGTLKELDEAMKDPNSRVFKKAQSLHKRTKKALETGAELTIKEDDKGGADPSKKGNKSNAPATDNQELSVADLHEAIVTSVSPRKGDICCYMIFTSLENHDERIKPLLAKMPKFQRRKAIERAEAMGVERTSKKAS